MRSHPLLVVQRVVMTVVGLVVAFQVSSPSPADEPSSLSGTWAWTWKDADGTTHKHILDVETADGKLTARERYDDLPSIKVDDLSLEGGEVSFVIARGERRAEYKGKLVGDKTLNGVVNVMSNGQSNEYQWTAERQLKPKAK